MPIVSRKCFLYHNKNSSLEWQYNRISIRIRIIFICKKYNKKSIFLHTHTTQINTTDGSQIEIIKYNTKI